jgi:hypothetical protein
VEQSQAYAHTAGLHVLDKLFSNGMHGAFARVIRADLPVEDTGKHDGLEKNH